MDHLQNIFTEIKAHVATKLNITSHNIELCHRICLPFRDFVTKMKTTKNCTCNRFFYAAASSIRSVFSFVIAKCVGVIFQHKHDSIDFE